MLHKYSLFETGALEELKLIWVLLLLTWTSVIASHSLFCGLLADGQKQEVSLGGGASRQCFYDLTPSSQYQISIHTQLPEKEGPSISITNTTSTLQVFHNPPPPNLFEFLHIFFYFSSILLKKLTNPCVLIFVLPISCLVLYFSICLLSSHAVSPLQLSVLQFLFFFCSHFLSSLSEKTEAAVAVHWSAEELRWTAQLQGPEELNAQPGL